VGDASNAAHDERLLVRAGVSGRFATAREALAQLHRNLVADERQRPLERPVRLQVSLRQNRLAESPPIRELVRAFDDETHSPDPPSLVAEWKWVRARQDRETLATRELEQRRLGAAGEASRVVAGGWA
jgi:hypothetical protein